MNCQISVLKAFVLVLGVSIGLAGCAMAPSQTPQAAPAPVEVSNPVEQYLTDHADFTGRTAAVDSVELRSRVWGYLARVNIQEGALIEEGDVLFEIEPHMYQATLDQAKGNVSQAEARLARLDADLARAERLVSRGAMSREEYDRTVGDQGQKILYVPCRVALRTRTDGNWLDLELDLLRTLADKIRTWKGNCQL